MTDLEFQWPVGTQFQGVKFADPAAGSLSLAELPAPLRHHALLVPANDQATLQVLSIPLDHADAPDLADSIRDWLLPAGGTLAGYQLVTMHGAQTHWCLPRIALVAPADRLDAVRQAVLEAAYLELELRAVETGLANLWPNLEADAPLAFEFQERDMRKRKQLAQRFQQALLLRSRLARITPRLLMPQAYPPTLPGQVHERLRERLGMAHRVEALETQLEVFERIYDGCGDRVSEYVHARKSLAVEWVIVVLLALQTFLVLFELLTNTRS